MLSDFIKEAYKRGAVKNYRESCNSDPYLLEKDEVAFYPKEKIIKKLKSKKKGYKTKL